jgi:hypothetical protein
MARYLPRGFLQAAIDRRMGALVTLKEQDAALHH